MSAQDLVAPRSTPARSAERRGGLRIALVQTQAEAAGAQEISRLLALDFAGRGHDVHQVFFFRRTAAFDQDPTAVICAAERPRGPLAFARFLLALYRNLRRLRPDVVITFQHYGNLIGAPVARLAGVDRVIANHNGMQDILSAAVIRLDRWLGLLGAYTRIVVNSDLVEAEYGRYPRRYRDRLVRIDHGFSAKTSRLTKADARTGFGLPEDGVVLGCVARLHANKRLDAAIRLLPARPTWRLALAGQGPEEQALGQLASELGCRDRVHFVGELSPARVGDLLAALDVFVFPSRSETFGLAAVEAAGVGVPIVAARLAVLEDVLSHDGEPCALFVDVEDTTAFTAAVDRLLEDHGLAQNFGARGRRLNERFPIHEMVDAYGALLRSKPNARVAPAAAT